MDNIILEGVGINQVIVGKTTANELKDLFGTSYNIIRHDNDNVEIFYPQKGISFYYNDGTEKIIDYILVKIPFNGKTTKGIIINQSTVQDVENLYGEAEWITTITGSLSNYWALSYPYEGIEFWVKKEKSWFFKKKDYTHKIIEEIGVEIKEPPKPPKTPSKLYTYFLKLYGLLFKKMN